MNTDTGDETVARAPIMLDLGAGDVWPEGYTPLGHKHHGSEIYPLPYADNSVDVVRASHVLEHFSHRQVAAVLADWVRVLKPGGILRVAVPDFEKLKDMPGDARVPLEWVIMGGQSDADDFHKSLFDRESLRQRFAQAGLVLLRGWKTEIADCAEYEISLNLEGTKPAVGEIAVSAAMSVPRLGWMDNFGCCIDALLPLRIKLRRQGGAFWGQALTRCLELILEQDKPDAILTLDYDSVFTKQDVAIMMQLMMAHPEADAIAAIQSSRHIKTALFTKTDADGKPVAAMSTAEFEDDLTPINSAHFGLTLIRASKLASLPRPWFIPVPDEDGRWTDEKKIDEDVNFWKKWREAGNTLFLANRIPIGHIEVMARWPGRDLQVIYQSMREWNDDGKPPEGVWK